MMERKAKYARFDHVVVIIFPDVDRADTFIKALDTQRLLQASKQLVKSRPADVAVKGFKPRQVA